jgi:hypothetical protein
LRGIAVSRPHLLTIAAVAAIAGLLLPCTAASADEFPRRKAGLWEMKTTGGPVGAQSIQQCIDAATDDLLRSRSNEGQNCSKPAVERDGSRYRVRSSCDNNGIRSTIDGRYTMSSDKRYTGDMKMTFDPPMSGVAEMNMKMDGKWLGPCKAGMKPGDIVMQGMPRLNPLQADQDGATGITPEQSQQMTDQMQKNMSRRGKAQPQ